MRRGSVRAMLVSGGKRILAVSKILLICGVVCQTFPLGTIASESQHGLSPVAKRLCTPLEDPCYEEFIPAQDMTCDFGTALQPTGPAIIACNQTVPWFRSFLYYKYQFDVQPLPDSETVADSFGGFFAQSRCTLKPANTGDSALSVAMIRSPTYNPVFSPLLPLCREYQLSLWLKLESEPAFSQNAREKYLLEIEVEYPVSQRLLIWGTEEDYREKVTVGSWSPIKFRFFASRAFSLNFLAYHKDDCVAQVPTAAISVDSIEMGTGVLCPPTTTTPVTTTTTTTPTTASSTSTSTTTTVEITSSVKTSTTTELTTSTEIFVETTVETTAEVTTESSGSTTESSTASTPTSPTTPETTDQITVSVETGTSTVADTTTAETTSDWTSEPTVSETMTETTSETTSRDSALSSSISEMTSESPTSETTFETTDEPASSEATSEASSGTITDSTTTNDMYPTTSDPTEGSTVSSSETASSTWESSAEPNTDDTSDTSSGTTDEFPTSNSHMMSTETTWETSSEASTGDTTTDETLETTAGTTDESTNPSFETVSPETTWKTSSETSTDNTTTGDSSETTAAVTDQSTSSSSESVTPGTTWETSLENSPDGTSETASGVTDESITSSSETFVPETTWETSPEITGEDTSETTSDSRETTISETESSTEKTGETDSTLTVSEETASVGTWETTAGSGTTSNDTTSPESQPVTTDESTTSDSITETPTDPTLSETTSEETTESASESESSSESEKTTSDTTLGTSSADTTFTASGSEVPETTPFETITTSETRSFTESTPAVTTSKSSTPSTPPVPRPPNCGPGGSVSVEDNSCECNPGLVLEGNRCRCPLLQFYSGSECREVPVLLRSTYTVIATFRPELNDRKSPEFLKFAEALRAQLLEDLALELLAVSPLGPQVAEVDFEVLSLSNGSVVADVLFKVQTADTGRQETIRKAWEKTELVQLNVDGVVSPVSTSPDREYFDRCQLFDNVQYCGYGATCRSSSDNKITECECAPGKNYRSDSRSCLDPDPTSDDDVYLILYIVAGVSGGVVLIGALGFFVFHKRNRNRPKRPNHYTDPLESSSSAFELPARTHWTFANRNQDDAESQYSDGFDPPALSSGYASSSRRTSFSSARQSYRDYDTDKKK